MPDGLFDRPRRVTAATRPARPVPPAAGEGAGQPHPLFVLLDRFRDFYIALTRERRRVVTGGPTASAAAAGAAAGGPWQVLLSLLQAQARAAAKANAAAPYAEAQYLMAAFADEVFLDFVWPGRSAWAADPLEKELFGTTDGRDEVFVHLDALLARGVTTDPDLARTYLLALALGFRGRYRGGEERSHLDAYRARLIEELREHGLAPPDTAAIQLFPDAYLATRSQGERGKLPAVRIWTAALLSALVLYGIVSYRVWDRATAPLATAVGRILSSP